MPACSTPDHVSVTRYVPLMPNLPESDVLDVRDYIYVDERRVQMLLAQFGGGLSTDKEISRGRSSRIQAGLGMMMGSRERSTSESERLSLADLNLSRLEEDALAMGMMADVSDRAGRPKFWKRGNIRNSIEPGSLLRVTAPTTLMDPSAIVSTMKQIDAFDDDPSDSTFSEMMQMAEALYGDALAYSVRPAGADEPECAFIGSISHESTFGSLDRGLLFSRMGPDAPILTNVFMVSRIPTEREEGPSAMDRLANIGQQIVRASDDRIDRNLLDDMMIQMMAVLEDFGAQKAPRWPAISVVPLAVYRNVPVASIEDEVD